MSLVCSVFCLPQVFFIWATGRMSLSPSSLLLSAVWWGMDAGAASPAPAVMALLMEISCWPQWHWPVGLTAVYMWETSTMWGGFSPQGTSQVSWSSGNSRVTLIHSGPWTQMGLLIDEKPLRSIEIDRNAWKAQDWWFCVSHLPVSAGLWPLNGF